MNRNVATLKLRTFTRPMTWASDSILETMRAELSEELQLIHESVWKLGAARNGLVDVEREIKWRIRTEAAAVRSTNPLSQIFGRTAGDIGLSTGGMAKADSVACDFGMEAQA